MGRVCVFRFIYHNSKCVESISRQYFYAITQLQKALQKKNVFPFKPVVSKNIFDTGLNLRHSQKTISRIAEVIIFFKTRAVILPENFSFGMKALLH